MISDKSFNQEMRDYFGIIIQGQKDIMTSNQDVMDAIAALSTAQGQLNTSINTAIADMGTGGDAARVAMVTAITSVATQMATMQTELLAAIAAQTPPPAVASPAPPAPTA